MKQLTLISLCMITFLACSKDDTTPATNTHTSDLPIVAAGTPATATAGQGIVANVRCQLTFLGGDVIFKGFAIEEMLPHRFNIRAKADYKNWGDVAQTIMWTLDTTAIIKTTTPGRYILHFYNAASLVKTDTVDVK